MKPVLKWAGSKYKIVTRILESLPRGRRLIEPFAGSGAVFLNAEYEEFLVADSNADLIGLYKHVQSQGSEFVDYASSLFVAENNSEAAFYALRQEFNSTTETVRRSALFIYLNRHCFNGLCRYNLSGKFNVPFGRYSSPAFPRVELLNFYEKSKRAVFEVAEFKASMEMAEPGSVIYCDPPYAPLTATANFSAYTQSGFSLVDQRELAAVARTLVRRGIPVVISNHDTEFTRSIYADATIKSFDVQRFISSDVKNRGKAAELLACYV
jgi:DNA adenine methylase